ncbi:MAG: cell division protein ZapA [Myxococcota bacterium]|jgi:cell division protein ZapA (FtsZ GTPase activity inhibitor)|nr:cell division protein ZapA [Myxococcota bacterium]
MKRVTAKKAEAAARSESGVVGEAAAEEIIEQGGERQREERPSVSVRLGGKDYRLRSHASEKSLQQVASYVDLAMQKIRERTDTVDSQDIALLTSLNLAREVLQLREQVEAGGAGSVARLRSLIELVEAELPVEGA